MSKHDGECDCVQCELEHERGRTPPMSDPNEAPDQSAARLGLPVEWTRMHEGRHRCVDHRWYTYSCLVSDPTCHRAAMSYLAIARKVEADE